MYATNICIALVVVWFSNTYYYQCDLDHKISSITILCAHTQQTMMLISQIFMNFYAHEVHIHVYQLLLEDDINGQNDL